MASMEDAWNTAAGVSDKIKHWLEEQSLLWIQGMVPAAHKGSLATALEPMHNIKKLNTEYTVNSMFFQNTSICLKVCMVWEHRRLYNLGIC